MGIFGALSTSVAGLRAQSFSLENISGNIGAQYLRIRAVVGNLLEKDNFVYHLLDSQPPGTVVQSVAYRLAGMAKGKPAARDDGRWP